MHPKGANSMAVSELCSKMALVVTGRAIFCMNELIIEI